MIRSRSDASCWSPAWRSSGRRRWVAAPGTARRRPMADGGRLRSVRRRTRARGRADADQRRRVHGLAADPARHRHHAVPRAHDAAGHGPAGRRRHPDASGLFNLMRNLGGVVGLSIIATILYGRAPTIARRHRGRAPGRRSRRGRPGRPLSRPAGQTRRRSRCTDHRRRPAPGRARGPDRGVERSLGSPGPGDPCGRADPGCGRPQLAPVVGARAARAALVASRGAGAAPVLAVSRAPTPRRYSPGRSAAAGGVNRGCVVHDCPRPGTPPTGSRRCRPVTGGLLGDVLPAAHRGDLAGAQEPPECRGPARRRPKRLRDTVAQSSRRLRTLVLTPTQSPFGERPMRDDIRPHPVLQAALIALGYMMLAGPPLCVLLQGWP